MEWEDNMVEAKLFKDERGLGNPLTPRGIVDVAPEEGGIECFLEKC